MGGLSWVLAQSLPSARPTLCELVTCNRVHVSQFSRIDYLIPTGI